MDPVEIFLLWVVGFSVLVFLILDHLNSFEESSKSRRAAEQRKVRIRSSAVGLAKESDHQEEGNSAGADGEAEKEEFSRNFKRSGIQEIAEEKEMDHPVSVKCAESGGNTVEEGDEEFIDDWEGIQRTELEKIFGEAVVFVSRNSNANQIADVKLQLYGLQKVALEGPSHGSPPMALNICARSKWNAWHKLGNMSRELAMEKYINILSEAIPGWKGEDKLTIQNATTSEDLTSIQ